MGRSNDDVAHVLYVVLVHPEIPPNTGNRSASARNRRAVAPDRAAGLRLEDASCAAPDSITTSSNAPASARRLARPSRGARRARLFAVHPWPDALRHVLAPGDAFVFGPETARSAGGGRRRAADGMAACACRCPQPQPQSLQRRRRHRVRSVAAAWLPGKLIRHTIGMYPIQNDNAFMAEGLRGTKPEPTFAGALSFLRRRYTRELAGVDVAVTGIPLDTATTNRPGARFGPRAIRAASCQMAWTRPYGWPFDPLDRLAVVDYGDCAWDLGRPEGIPAGDRGARRCDPRDGRGDAVDGRRSLHQLSAAEGAREAATGRCR